MDRKSAFTSPLRDSGEFSYCPSDQDGPWDIFGGKSGSRMRLPTFGAQQSPKSLSQLGLPRRSASFTPHRNKYLENQEFRETILRAEQTIEELETETTYPVPKGRGFVKDNQGVRRAADSPVSSTHGEGMLVIWKLVSVPVLSQAGLKSDPGVEASCGGNVFLSSHSVDK